MTDIEITDCNIPGYAITAELKEVKLPTVRVWGEENDSTLQAEIDTFIERTNFSPLEHMRYIYRVSQVGRVVDGDTVDLTIDLGLGVYRQERIRLYGYDAFELHGEFAERGQLAKLALYSLLAEVEPEDKIWIRTIKDRTGKYGRLLGVVVVESVDKANKTHKLSNVNQLMFQAGHALKLYL